MKVSEKKETKSKNQEAKGKDSRTQEAKNKASKPKPKAAKGNEAKPTEKGLKRRPNSNNNPTADTLRTPPVRAWAAVW